MWISSYFGPICGKDFLPPKAYLAFLLKQSDRVGLFLKSLFSLTDLYVNPYANTVLLTLSASFIFVSLVSDIVPDTQGA